MASKQQLRPRFLCDIMILLMMEILNRVNKVIKIKGWVAERLNAPALKAGDSLRSS